MRCHICNKTLDPEEIRYVEKMVGHRFGPFDPCGKCLTVIHEVFEDHDDVDDPDRFIDPDEISLEDVLNEEIPE